MRYLPIIKDGVVVNVAAVPEDADWTPPAGCEIGPEGGEIGCTWDGTQYSAPTPPAPRTRPTLTLERKLGRLGLTVAELKSALTE